MRIAYFTHSLKSCWNHGNAHFQRGILLSLQKLGHDVTAWEPAESWSYGNLVADQGPHATASFSKSFSTLNAREYSRQEDLELALDGVDLVVVHEWTDPDIVAAIGRIHRREKFMLLFHDTHHRAVSDPEAIWHFDLTEYDGILAFGATLARIYEDWGWAGRVFVWHEAADTSIFHPPAHPKAREGAVWVGNWGDGERSAELEQFLLAPAQQAAVPLDVYGVRYPETALDMLGEYGARFHGWIANADVPHVFARHRFTVHVPRQYYTRMLPGIPTIRMFEALACGIPLIAAPWNDAEGLFRKDTDYLMAETSVQMREYMRALSNDDTLTATLAQAGRERILAHHSCDVRAAELLDILARLSNDAVVA